MDQDIVGSQFFVGGGVKGAGREGREIYGRVAVSQEKRGLQTDHFGSRNNISMVERNILNSQFLP